MDLKELRALVRLMVDNDLTELDVQDPKGSRVTLKRASPAAAVLYAQPEAPAVAQPAVPAPPTRAEEALTPITSPMVGTFFAAPSPDAKPFVAVGDRVAPDKVVCIIEAMKVFNEIKAEVAGRVEKVLVAPGKAVEFGQLLFLVRPE